MDVMGELQTIVQSSGFSRAKLALLLREMQVTKEKRTRVRREPAPLVTCYISVKRNYTCLHCGHKFSSTVELKKGEDTAVIVAGGSVMVINSASPAEVDCIANHCSWCAEFVSRLTREELEERYITLLSLVSLERSNPFNKPTGCVDVKL